MSCPVVAGNQTCTLGKNKPVPLGHLASFVFLSFLKVKIRILVFVVGLMGKSEPGDLEHLRVGGSRLLTPWSVLSGGALLPAASLGGLRRTAPALSGTQQNPVSSPF